MAWCMRQCPHGTRGSKQSRRAETAYAVPSSLQVVPNQVPACGSRLRQPSHIIYLCERCRVEQEVTSATPRSPSATT